ncbi:MAG: O-antigen ligase family protein [bacterium]
MASRNMAISESPAKNVLKMLMVLGLTAIGLLAIAYFTSKGKIAFVFGGIFLVALVMVAIKRSEFAVYTFVFVLYTNFAVIAKKLYGVPDMIAASFVLLLIFPLIDHVVKRREKFVFDKVMVLQLLFITALLASSLVALNKKIAFGAIIEFAIEGMLLFFLVINAIRTRKMLEHALWTWLIAASLLGSLSLIQETTGTKNTFFGLAQRFAAEGEAELPNAGKGEGLLGQREKVRTSDRAGGPVNAPNRYAQLMLMVLPIAVFKLWGAKNKKIKRYALLTSFLIFCGVLLSYSRGGFITMSLMVLFLTALRYIRLKQLLRTLAIVIVLMPIAAPGYFARLDTIRGIEALFNEDAEVKADGPTRGRLTEMLAALLCYIDHPIIGVGPGQYTPYYSYDYQKSDEIAFRHIDKGRRAHILYFELMAETGTLGFLVFMGIAFYVFQRLWKIRKEAADIRPDIANMATAFCFCMFAYFGTSIFLHMAYQRYYWFLLALAVAAIKIFGEELREEDEMEVAHSEDGIIARV